MIADLKPYPEYKESCLPWLGQVPVHWEVKRARSSVANVVEQTSRMDSGDRYVALENIESWTGRVRPQQGERLFIGQVKRFRKDDVLFGKLRPYLAKVTRPQNGGVCVGELFVLRPRDASIRSDFLEQQLRAKPTIDVINSSTFGAKMPRADWQFVGNLSLIFPPPAEQAAIVRFLDWATGRLERAIRAKRKVIALLNEQKQAIIHRAVTRGLDPSVRLKPSGVPWLGDIPQHWEYTAVWQLFEIGRGKVTSHQYIGDHPGPYPLYSSQTENDGVMGRIDSYLFDGDYLTWTTDGAHAGTVFRRSGKFSCTNVCGTLRSKGHLDLDFMRMSVASETKRHVRIDINPKLMNNMMARIRVVVPPYEEQVEIATYVGRAVMPGERAISRLEREIELLREYRTRLIADVVTGKLDVRGAEIPDEPGRTDESDPIEECEVESDLPADWLPEDNNE